MVKQGWRSKSFKGGLLKSGNLVLQFQPCEFDRSLNFHGYRVSHWSNGKTEVKRIVELGELGIL